MLIDETAGSGGDLLPWMFRKFELGTLVGRRTWGGLVGVLGFPVLMDGGSVTAPNLGIWTPEDGLHRGERGRAAGHRGGADAEGGDRRAGPAAREGHRGRHGAAGARSRRSPRSGRRSRGPRCAEGSERRAIRSAGRDHHPPGHAAGAVRGPSRGDVRFGRRPFKRKQRPCSLDSPAPTHGCNVHPAFTMRSSTPRYEGPRTALSRDVPVSMALECPATAGPGALRGEGSRIPGESHGAQGSGRPRA